MRESAYLKGGKTSIMLGLFFWLDAVFSIVLYRPIKSDFCQAFLFELDLDK
jgi:hypothetical protein